jgi:hypothetical protein
MVKNSFYKKSLRTSDKMKIFPFVAGYYGEWKTSGLRIKTKIPHLVQNESEVFLSEALSLILLIILHPLFNLLLNVLNPLLSVLRR